MAINQYKNEIDEIKFDIKDKINGYGNILTNLQALLSIRPDLTREEWLIYMASLDLSNKYPGARNVHFARYVQGNEKETYENRMKKVEGFPGYHIFPEGKRREYFPIEYIFPLTQKFRIGYDLESEPNRWFAITRTVATGEISSTKRLLSYEGNSPGFSLLLPIYRRGLPLQNVDERRNALVGIASVHFVMDQLIPEVVEASPHRLNFEIFDEGSSNASETPLPWQFSKDQLLFSSTHSPDLNAAGNPSSEFVQLVPIDIAGEQWVIRFMATDVYMTEMERHLPDLLLVFGLFLSASLFGLSWNIQTSRGRAEDLARKMNRDLLASEEKFRSISVTAMDGILTADRNGKITFYNQGAARILGYSQEEILGKPFDSLMPDRFQAEYREKFRQILETRKESGSGEIAEIIARTRDGREVPVEISLTTWRIENDRVFTAIVRDLTERKRAEAALTQKSSFVRMLYVTAAAANESTDLNKALQTSLEEICSHTGWLAGHVYFPDREQTGGMLPSALWHISDQERIIKFKNVLDVTPLGLGEGLPGQVLRGGRALWLKSPEEDSSPARVNAALEAGIKMFLAFPLTVGLEVVAVMEFYSAEVSEPDESVLEIMAHIGTQLGRVVERDRVKSQLDFLAWHDPLTGLPNRVLFSDRLNHAIVQAPRNRKLVGVLFIDLDLFKRINDTLGHNIGDIALKSAGERLMSCVRSGDTVSRWGGDEFTILLENIAKPQDVSRVAQKILDSLKAPIKVLDNEFFISASIGISLFPHDGDTVDVLLKNADTAMYRAKEKGRNNYQLYSRDMNSEATNKLVMEHQLRYALEKNEMALHYQPLIDLRTKKIVGAEALIRWNHPVLGQVPPLQFIPMAEETGLIVQIGEWVLRTACKQAKTWQDAGYPPMRVAVNLSVRQFQSPDLQEIVHKILEETGLDSNWLELELTESMIMQKGDESIETLYRLNAMGIHLSVDDFGTGYSSLSYLKRFPIETLKIDQSFVRDIPKSADDVAIARAIIAMAHNLKLKVVAEAVETEEQMEFLRAHFCDEIQGYYVSRPLPPAEFEAYLDGRRLASSAPLN